MNRVSRASSQITLAALSPLQRGEVSRDEDHELPEGHRLIVMLSNDCKPSILSHLDDDDVCRVLQYRRVAIPQTKTTWPDQS